MAINRANQNWPEDMYEVMIIPRGEVETMLEYVDRVLTSESKLEMELR